MDERTRRLRDVCEPIGANVYFAPEAHERYRALGMNGASGYFCSRSASMGQLDGWTVAATFGVFSPNVVVPAVAAGWAVTDRASVLRARYDGATASLRRLLVQPDEAHIRRAVERLQRGLEVAHHAGHPIFSGLKSLPWPDEPLGQLWRCCDMVREHRGDSHIAVWTRAGIAPVEIQLMEELRRHIPLKTYSRTRGYTDEEMDAALEGMRRKGWVEGDALSEEGRRLRDEIENDTDAMEVNIVEAIGADFTPLIDILRRWAVTIVKAGIAGGGYPGDINELGGMATRSWS